MSDCICHHSSSKVQLLGTFLLCTESHDSTFCINMLNWDLLCSVNIMLHRVNLWMKQNIYTAEQVPIDDSAEGGLTQFWELFTAIPCLPKDSKR